MLSLRLLPLFALIFSCALAGCGRNSSSASSEEVKFGNGTIRWESFPVEILVESKTLSDAAFAQDLDDAVKFWESKAGKSLITVRSTEESVAVNSFTGQVQDPDNILFSALFFYSPWPFEKNVAGNTVIRSRGGKFQAGLILLNSETSLCGGDCTNISALSRRKLIAHELGHFLGLDHSTEKNNLMYPEILSGGSLDAVQVDSTTLDLLTR